MLGGGFRDNSQGKPTVQKFVNNTHMMKTNYNNQQFPKLSQGSNGRVNEILLES